VEIAIVNSHGDNDEIKISISPERSFDMPLVGIGRSTRIVPLTENEIAVLKNLNFDHYRVDLYLFNTDWRMEAGKAADEAGKLNYTLELALFFDENFKSQSDEFSSWITNRNPVVSVINLFHKTEAVTPGWLTDHLAPRLKQILPKVKIACGTNANFAQLNGHFPSSGLVDQICYSIHPQEHASDNSTLVENLRAQSDSVLSARHYSAGKDILVSPVNIQRRFNANIENFESVKHHNSMPSQVDTRQMSLFCAGWTAVSLKYLGEAGVKGVTYFETAGERGIFQGDFNSSWPSEFRSASGMIFPVYHLFHFLLRNKSFKIISGSSDRPLKADCICLSDGKRLKSIIASFTHEKQKVLFQGLSGEFRIKRLDADTFADAATDKNWSDKNWKNKSGNEDLLELEPFSVSFIEGNI
jgi:hypothetical protein